MTSKADEIAFYGSIYLLTFGKDRTFFYENASDVICQFLVDNYWGENLVSRVNLLSKLLCFDSFVHPKIKDELVRKSREVSNYFNQNPK
ncbi:hypothetical protein FACS189426_11990 [Bacteroidia bacterium]|nr:hypothetical protein FACS189426_11990 [Bacteroidia bacterium]GHV70367.1 hypothetical protein FACS189420_1170 [Bacteroidia bacterium]